MPEDIERNPAEQRITQERDQFKEQASKATAALGDALTTIRLAEQFSALKVQDPVAVATRAARDFADLTPDTPADEVKARAITWRDEQVRLAQSLSDEPAPPEPSLMAGANPSLTTPGLPADMTPVVVGSKEYYAAGWHNRSDAEQIEAMRKGDLVSSNKVKQQQQSVVPGL